MIFPHLPATHLKESSFLSHSTPPLPIIRGILHFQLPFLKGYFPLFCKTTDLDVISYSHLKWPQLFRYSPSLAILGTAQVDVFMLYLMPYSSLDSARNLLWFLAVIWALFYAWYKKPNGPLPNEFKLKDFKHFRSGSNMCLLLKDKFLHNLSTTFISSLLCTVTDIHHLLLHSMGSSQITDNLPNLLVHMYLQLYYFINYLSG